jgi:hypothetical protein
MEQVHEKRELEVQNTDVLEVLTKGKNYIRCDTWIHHGLCSGYRMLTMLSNSLLELYEYYHCPHAYEDLLDDEEDLEELGRRAYIEVGNADKIMAISSIEEFEKIYRNLYECVRSRNGWGKTVKCVF